MKALLLVHAGVVAALTLMLAYTHDTQVWVSALAGGATSMFNLAVLVFAWPRLLAKKRVALATATIVFKFALLGWILYLVVHSEYIRLGWFAIGLGTVIASVVAAAVLNGSEPTPPTEKAET